MKKPRALIKLGGMNRQTTWILRLACTALPLLVAACSPPPLTRSVSIQRRAGGSAGPLHANGRVRQNTYIVARGDTLYSIAFRIGVDYRDLARWNGIDAPYVIYPGQHLRTSPPPRVAHHPAPVFQPVRPPTAKPRVPAPSASTANRVVVAGAATAATPVEHASVTPAADVPRAPVREEGGIAWRWPATGAVISGYDAHDAIPGLQIGGKRGAPVRAAAAGTVVYSGDGLVGYGELIIIKHSDNYLSAYGHNSRRLVKEGEHVKAGQVIADMGSTGAPRVELEFQIRRNGKPVDPMAYLPKR